MFEQILKYILCLVSRADIYMSFILKKNGYARVLICSCDDLNFTITRYLQRIHGNRGKKIYFETLDKRANYQNFHIDGVLINGIKAANNFNYLDKFDCIFVCSKDSFKKIVKLIDTDKTKVILLEIKFDILRKLTKKIKFFLNHFFKKKNKIENQKTSLNGHYVHEYDPFYIVYSDYQYLYVEHIMGGGTNFYSSKKIREFSNSGYIHLTYYKHQYHLNIYKHSEHFTLTFSTLVKLAEFLKKFNFKEVHLANLVGFEGLSDLLAVFIEYKETNVKSKLIVYVHDFFSCCPSFSLVNEKDVFCDLPDLHICHHCYVQNHNFVTVYKNNFNMSDWRNIWRNLFALSDKIICFSFSSAEILQKIYDVSNVISIEPHDMSYFKLIRQQYNDNLSSIKTNKKEIIVGILGNVNVLKGLNKILELASEINRNKESITIKVFGTIECKTNQNTIFKAGNYTHSNLINRLNDESIDMILFPSICPETFSYTVSEVIMIGLPLICYNLGAQAEKVKTYKNGHVIDLSTTPIDLIALIKSLAYEPN